MGVDFEFKIEERNGTVITMTDVMGERICIADSDYPARPDSETPALRLDSTDYPRIWIMFEGGDPITLDQQMAARLVLYLRQFILSGSLGGGER